jgi:hypothetical protein
LLDTNEVRARAAEFARDWKAARYERGEAQSVYNESFNVFGMKRRQVATFDEPVKRLGDKRGFLDLFWKSMLLVEHKSAGKNLARAREQALDYFSFLKPEDLPRYLLAISRISNSPISTSAPTSSLRSPTCPPMSKHLPHSSLWPSSAMTNYRVNSCKSGRRSAGTHFEIAVRF